MLQIALVNQAQAGERQIRIDFINHVGIAFYQMRHAAGSNHADILSAQFALHLPDDLLHRANIAVQNACLNIGYRRFANNLRRKHQFNGGQLRRARGKRAVHHAQAGADRAAEKLRFGRNHAVCRRRAEIDEDRRAAIQRRNCHRVGNAVAAQLARIFIANIQPRLHAGHEQTRLQMEVIPAHVLDGIVDGRHDGGNHDALHRLHVQVVITEQIRHDDPILIGSHHRVGRAAPALDQTAAFKNGGFDIGVANIHCNDHNLLSPNGFLAMSVHPAHGLEQRAADRRARNGAHNRLHQPLHARQQNNEHQRIARAFRQNKALDVIRMIKRKHDIAHEEERVEQRRGQRRHKAIRRGGFAGLAHAAVDQTHAQAHQHPHAEAQNKRVNRRHAQQRRSHNGCALDRVHKAHKAENAAEQHAGHRPDDNRANGNRHGQKRHVQRPDRHAAQADELHHHFNRHENGKLRQRLHADLLFRLSIHFYPPFGFAQDTRQVFAAKRRRKRKQPSRSALHAAAARIAYIVPNRR